MFGLASSDRCGALAFTNVSTRFRAPEALPNLDPVKGKLRQDHCPAEWLSRQAAVEVAQVCVQIVVDLHSLCVGARKLGA